MKRLFFVTIVLLLLLFRPCFGDMNISNLEVKALISNKYLVQYSWKMDVSFSGGTSKGCTVKLSFLDSSGFEIYSKSRYVSLASGSNHLKGQGICKPDVWRRVKEYKAHIRCP